MRNAYRLLDSIPVLQPVSLFLIIEDPADNFANTNIVVQIDLARHGGGALAMNALATILHLLQALLPDREISGPQVNPAFFSPYINIVVCNHYFGFDTFWDTDVGATNNLRTIGHENR